MKSSIWLWNNSKSQIFYSWIGMCFWFITFLKKRTVFSSQNLPKVVGHRKMEYFTERDNTSNLNQFEVMAFVQYFMSVCSLHRLMNGNQFSHIVCHLNTYVSPAISLFFHSIGIPFPTQKIPSYRWSFSKFNWIWFRDTQTLSQKLVLK